ncbi:MAG TPA: TonB family protein [Burkholderiales bacterium]|nr:TonB family protein [Burkholderiales bacterium]
MILIYALVNGLARKIVQVVMTQPLETKIIEETRSPLSDKPPPPPPPKLAAPPLPTIPLPEVQVKVQMPVPVLVPVPMPVQAPQPAPTITAVTRTKPTEPVVVPERRIAPTVRHVPVRTPPVVDAKACEKPEYPPASLQAQETGIVLVAFLIDVNGAVIKSKVARSSGYRRLDEAARRALSLCKFKPAMVDGKPVRAWAKLEYQWKLDD